MYAVTCTSEHWTYEVLACGASSEVRPVVYSWTNGTKACNFGDLPDDTDIECGKVTPLQPPHRRITLSLNHPLTTHTHTHPSTVPHHSIHAPQPLTRHTHTPLNHPLVTHTPQLPHIPQSTLFNHPLVGQPNATATVVWCGCTSITYHTVSFIWSSVLWCWTAPLHCVTCVDMFTCVCVCASPSSLFPSFSLSLSVLLLDRDPVEGN